MRWNWKAHVLSWQTGPLFQHRQLPRQLCLFCRYLHAFWHIWYIVTVGLGLESNFSKMLDCGEPHLFQMLCQKFGFSCKGFTSSFQPGILLALSAWILCNLIVLSAASLHAFKIALRCFWISSSCGCISDHDWELLFFVHKPLHDHVQTFFCSPWSLSLLQLPTEFWIDQLPSFVYKRDAALSLTDTW